MLELPVPLGLPVRLVRKATKATLVLPVLLELPVPLVQPDQQVPPVPPERTGKPAPQAVAYWELLA